MTDLDDHIECEQSRWDALINAFIAIVAIASVFLLASFPTGCATKAPPPAPPPPTALKSSAPDTEPPTVSISFSRSFPDQKPATPWLTNQVPTRYTLDKADLAFFFQPQQWGRVFELQWRPAYAPDAQAGLWLQDRDASFFQLVNPTTAREAVFVTTIQNCDSRLYPVMSN